ncbi:DUF1788 domain-containing protein [Alicyclobacillus macrosporangiidus]|uniref:DUF1788 domain-containing protein n=1 Tax=Alicyclobacillus macrosporangiidus TaxID=392015 RepID=UPI0004951F70|nr:DUF1788 domain-containing protein [Alicyclobacillus macrosporangiidus]
MATLERMLEDGTLFYNKSTGNELQNYIFDYPPEEELTIRSFVKRLVRQSPRRLVNINLFEAVLQMVDEETGIDRLFEIEAEEDSESLVDALSPMLESDRLIQRILQRAEDAEGLLLTGVGSLYPILRSHVVLNRLSERLTDIPVVLFFPGTYNGLQLRLFDLLTDDHYYRAIRITAG